MTAHAEMLARPIGPDAIGVPGDTERLKSAVQGINDLCRQIEKAGHQLKQANPPNETFGRSIGALSHIAQRVGRTLEADSEQLQRLVDALDHEADLLGDAQGNVDSLRSRWRQARQALRDVVHEHQARGGDRDKGKHDDAPINAEQLIDRLDVEAAEPHKGAFKRLAGLQFMEAGGGHGAFAVLSGSPLDQGIHAYKKEVGSLLEELADSMRKVKNADDRVAERLPRHPNAMVTEVSHGGDHQDDHAQVSGPRAIRHMSDEIHQGAQEVNQASHRLEDIRLAIRAGRMLPEDERIGSNDGFKRDWEHHFDQLRETLNQARRAADQVADRLHDLDQQGASDIRQALRDD